MGLVFVDIRCYFVVSVDANDIGYSVGTRTAKEITERGRLRVLFSEEALILAYWYYLKASRVMVLDETCFIDGFIRGFQAYLEGII